jgi:hypothetical protein
MRLLFAILAITIILACGVCYNLGYRSGLKRSLLEEDRRGLLDLTLAGYKAAESTNWGKVHSLLSVEILGFTRDYEKHFGVPTGTNRFVGRFAEAKAIADRVERRMVPVSDMGARLGTNVIVQ